ncbi:MAG: protein kinase [Acidobacteria bacterium]|nr:protein kinase [Acidobacteriota bacterium]
MDKAPADSLVGRTVAYYEIVARLGGGGMGLVYAARDTRLGRRVALKFLPPQWSHDESAKERFIREAQAASATDHPNICTIHDIGTTDDGQLFIVMAHYDGETLKQRLERGPVSVDEALDIAAQVAEGLAKAHAQGVIHRDIKPGNLMLTEDGVKILDFGLAKFADARFKLTLEGSTIGTIAYMSPEQVRGDEADARSDVWALGAVLYEMLAGDVPFKGGYPEAIAHAIKNEPPAPLRTQRPEVSEALEQLVFRALHKDPVVRFQSARDMARALRRLQGRTLPLDLRTEPLPHLDVTPAVMPRPRRRTTRRGLAAAAVLAAAVVGTPLWVFSPVERIPVAVAPVVNQTGYAELDPYRLALTEDLIARLADSRVVRVLPYERLLQIVRRFRQPDNDISSREALQAIATHTGARAIIIPALVYENGAWRARVEFRNPGTATNRATYDTEGVVSSLPKDAVYGLMPVLARVIDEHFLETGSRRAYFAEVARGLVVRAPPPRSSRLRTLDAAAALEQGLDAYERQEYAAALRAFLVAAKQDPRSPVPLAWQSRVARFMRRDKEAAETAVQALRLLTDQTPEADRLLVEAAAAESRRDSAVAEARYRELVARHPDEPNGLLELAAFLDRELRFAEAAEAYHDALRADDRLVRPHLELCRLYAPFRLNDRANARQQGEIALARYRALASRVGEAQTFWCLIDVLSVGGEVERDEARRHADAAVRIFEDLGYEYNLSRAYNYSAIAAFRQRRLVEAVSFWQRSLAAARTAGNVGLEASVLTNLGSTHANLGNAGQAIEYFRRSYELFEVLSEELQAAQNRANAAALVIDYGGGLEMAFRDIGNALAVFRKLGNRDYEEFSLRTIAAYHRNAGRYSEAERELNRARAIARERNFQERVARLTIDLARVRFDGAQYATASELLTEALGDGSGPWSVEARIRLGRTRVRLGDREGAQADLTQAVIDEQRDGALVPLFELARGELAYDSGRPGDARRHFAAAAAYWKDDRPDEASVEARARLGLIDALAGTARGLADIRAGLDHARRMGRHSLEQQCRLYLARIAIANRNIDEGLRILNEIPADDPSRSLGRELRAQVHYWRSLALTARGDAVGADSEAGRARDLLDQLRASMPGQYSTAFLSRPDIRMVIQ